MRRLQKLFHHGYLDRPVSQISFSNPLLGHEKMVYGLGDTGADLLADEVGIDRGSILWQEKNKEVGERYLQHTLMISSFRACLSLALRETIGAELLFWTRENSPELKDHVSFREEGRQRRLPIVPDGFFGIELPTEQRKQKVYFFLEADRSTMTNSRFLNKLRAYWIWGVKQKRQRKTFGIDNFRVLTITRTKQRRDNLTRVAQKADGRQNGSYMFWFATQEDYDLKEPGTVLQKIWQTSVARDQEFHHLLE